MEIRKIFEEISKKQPLKNPIYIRVPVDDEDKGVDVMATPGGVRHHHQRVRPVQHYPFQQAAECEKVQGRTAAEITFDGRYPIITVGGRVSRGSSVKTWPSGWGTEIRETRLRDMWMTMTP